MPPDDLTRIHAPWILKAESMCPSDVSPSAWPYLVSRALETQGPGESRDAALVRTTQWWRDALTERDAQRARANAGRQAARPVERVSAEPSLASYAHLSAARVQEKANADLGAVLARFGVAPKPVTTMVDAVTQQFPTFKAPSQNPGDAIFDQLREQLIEKARAEREARAARGE